MHTTNTMKAMNRYCLILLLLTLLCGATGSAQSLYVYATNGTVERLEDGKQWKSLAKAVPLDPKDVVRTQTNGSLTILDTERRKVYAVQSPRPAAVSALLSNQMSRGRSYTKEAFSAMTKALFGRNDVSMQAYRTKGGVTYRGDNVEEQLAAWLHAHLRGAGALTAVGSDYDISLHTLSPSSRRSSRSVNVGGSMLLLVENNSDEALYVNVIDVDADGVWSVVLPMDEAGTMAFTLVPPHSSVELPWPIEFFEPKGTDSLILLAHTEPYNLQHVIDLYTANPSTDCAVKAGVSIAPVQIR